MSADAKGHNMKASFDDFIPQFAIKQGICQNAFMNETHTRHYSFLMEMKH